jgi:hypothetical protein
MEWVEANRQRTVGSFVYICSILRVAGWLAGWVEANRQGTVGSFVYICAFPAVAVVWHAGWAAWWSEALGSFAPGLSFSQFAYAWGWASNR